MLNQTWSKPYGYVVLVGPNRSLFLEKPRADEFAAQHRGYVYSLFLSEIDFLAVNKTHTSSPPPYRGPERRKP